MHILNADSKILKKGLPMHTLKKKTSTVITLTIMMLSLFMATSSFGMIGFVSHHVAQKTTCATTTPLVSHVTRHRTALSPLTDHLHLAFERSISQTDKRHYKPTPGALNSRYGEIMQQKKSNKTRNKLTQTLRMLSVTQEALQQAKKDLDVCQNEKGALLREYCLFSAKYVNNKKKLLQANQIIEANNKKLYPHVTQEEVILATQGLEEIQKAYYNLICCGYTLTQEQSESLDRLNNIIRNAIKAPVLTLTEQTIAQCKSLEGAPEGSPAWVKRNIGLKYVQIGNYLYVKEYEKASRLLREILEDASHQYE